MPSTEPGLQNERPQRPGEFTFTWSIHNYSYCTMKENDFLMSPDFEVEILGKGKWYLMLYPKGYDAPGFASCCLARLDEGPSFNFTLSIRTADGQFKEKWESIYDAANTGILQILYSNFLSNEDLNGCLVNDTLTLRCRIWKTDTDIPISVKCDAHSKFEVSKLNYTWLLRDIAPWCEFNQSSNIIYYLKEIPTFKIHLMDEEQLSESDIYFGIEMQPGEETFHYLKCKIDFLDAYRKVVHSESREHLFQRSNQTEVFKFPLISKNNFYVNRRVYAPRGQLTLQCEFGFSSDNRLDTFEYQITNDIELHASMTEPHTEERELWIKNMQQGCKNGKFSDFIIRTPDQQFPVSRNILGAHSEVFCAMFERDMKERKSGVVEIEDLDDDTVSKMLLYVYTDTLGDMDCNAAHKLYLAADKYGITALQKKCSKYLMGCIEDSNVCDILELADMLRDQDLKACARDFVFAHAQSVMNSERWKKLLETNSALTSEIMQWMICYKYLT